MGGGGGMAFCASVCEVVGVDVGASGVVQAFDGVGLEVAACVGVRVGVHAGARVGLQVLVFGDIGVGVGLDSCLRVAVGVEVNETDGVPLGSGVVVTMGFCCSRKCETRVYLLVCAGVCV